MIPTPNYRPRPELTHQQALENELEDQAQFLRTYPHANILGGRTKSATLKRWCVTVVVLLALALLYWIFG